jgi:hypothetical protein
MIEESLRNAMTEAVRDLRVDIVDYTTIRSAKRRVASAVVILTGVMTAVAIVVAVTIVRPGTPQSKPATVASSSPSTGAEVEEQLRKMVSTLEDQLRQLHALRAEVSKDLRKIPPRSEDAASLEEALGQRRAELESEIATLQARLRVLHRRLAHR